MTKNEPEWEKEFDTKFCEDIMGRKILKSIFPTDIKDFIRSLLSKQKEEITKETEKRALESVRNEIKNFPIFQGHCGDWECSCMKNASEKAKLEVKTLNCVFKVIDNRLNSLKTGGKK